MDEEYDLEQVEQIITRRKQNLPGKRTRSSEETSSGSRSRSRRRRYYREKRREEERKEEERREEERREEERRRKEIDERHSRREREQDEARRDDQTVLVLNLSLKASERDIWKLFSEKCGKVRDIQIIRDTRSGKSKGVGYVEFYSQEALIKSLALSGTLLCGVPIKVQASQAEKNRAAKVAKQQAAEAAEGGPMKVYVGGLVDSLANITEDEIRQLFNPFGAVSSVDLHKDPYTGKCKGYAFITFRKATDAREAMTAMNGFEIAGRQLKVGFATDSLGHMTGLFGPNGQPLIGITGSAASLAVASQYAQDVIDNERLDDDGGGLLSGPNTRMVLMQKLSRQESQTHPNLVPPLVNFAPHFTTTQSQPSQGTVSSNVCWGNLFDKMDIPEDAESFFQEIIDDVAGECKKHGNVLKCMVNKMLCDGKVYTKFAGIDQSLRAVRALGVKIFGGRSVEAKFITDDEWTEIEREIG